MSKPAAVAFSGGKDSTAAIVTLQREGVSVAALTMRLGLDGESLRINRIRRLAEDLSVPLEIIDMRERFQRLVVQPFLDDYRSGLTPNPCVVCNQQVKFGLLRGLARECFDTDRFATGHYAAVVPVSGRRLLREPREIRKSQIYFLAMVDPGNLLDVCFPLSNLTLEEVRAMTAGFCLGNPAESQDVCFLQGRPLESFLHKHMPEMFRPGPIFDSGGRRLGTHDGAVKFTVGQRRGTRIAAGEKLYVIHKDTRSNILTLGTETDLAVNRLVVDNPQLWLPVQVADDLHVRIRSSGKKRKVRIERVTARTIEAKFECPARAVAPGQTAVFYRRDVVQAAGTIRTVTAG